MDAANSGVAACVGRAEISALFTKPHDAELTVKSGSRTNTDSGSNRKLLAKSVVKVLSPAKLIAATVSWARTANGRPTGTRLVV